ncbi:MAG: secretin N-terminal domain-containing protein [Thermodesulfobacteriota bacterium]
MTLRCSRAIGLLLLLFCLGWCLPAHATGNESALLDKLKGQPSSIRSENLRVDLLLRSIGKQAGVNIVMAETIDDTITLDVDNVNLYDVFQIIVDTKQLHYYEKNNILFVAKGGGADGRQQDVLTVRLCTQYANAGEYLDALKPLLSASGSLTVANRGNCLIVRDRDVNIARVEEMLAELDTPMPQVHIEARIVSISSAAKKELGIVWGLDNRKTSESVKFTSDLSLTAPTTNLTFGFLHSNLALDIDLQALQEENKLEILSAPRVMVVNGKEAEIKQGKEVPYVTQSGDIINTSFREANLSLKVTPRIIQEEFIDLALVVTNDSVDMNTSNTGEPLINKQGISTNLFLQNGVTAVIGGILQENKNHQQSGVPGLADLPLLGNLFKSTQKNDEKAELVVFITPTIVNLKSAVVDKEKTPGYAKKVMSRAKERDAAPTPTPQPAPTVPAPPAAPTTPAPTGQAQ